MESPTVLIVEDDRACGRYIRQQFHDHTSVAVVLAADAKTGLRLAQEIKIDALVSDLFFDQGNDWPEQKIYDGVDLAAAILRARPHLPTYFLSCFPRDVALHDKAEQKGVAARAWMQKSFWTAKHEDAPWRMIERDLFSRERAPEPGDAEAQSDQHSDDDPLVSLTIRLRRPFRTYIQELPDPELTVTHPIEAICTLDKGLVKANAPVFALLEDGFGETVQEALDDLAAVIQKQYEWLTNPNAKLEGDAVTVRDMLLTYLSRTVVVRNDSIAASEIDVWSLHETGASGGLSAPCVVLCQKATILAEGLQAFVNDMVTYTHMPARLSLELSNRDGANNCPSAWTKEERQALEAAKRQYLDPFMQHADLVPAMKRWLAMAKLV